MARALVFPGQGSQTVGMGKALAEAASTARAVFQEVDDALKQKLTTLIFEGDIETLTLTENAQPALMAVSIAALRLLEERSGWVLAELATHVAGHSLGEYSALAAAGSLSISDTAYLLRLRGQAMQQAVPIGIGTMAALLGLNLADVREIVDEAAAIYGVCAVANDNAPDQVVISGYRAAVEGAVALASKRGAKRAVVLPVSAPFHCSLMNPAADVIAEALATVQISPPCIPLVSNVTARPITDPAEVRRLLVEQITRPVRWRESVLYMRDQGIEELIELGAGRVLSGLTRRIDRRLRAFSIQTPSDLDEFLKSLS